MASSSDYVFTRDYLDYNRINLQHYLCVKVFGYRIHPSIPTKNRVLRIADIGTGTGIWLTDLAGTLPMSVCLDALEISFDATPLPEKLPSNMRLHHWDTKTDVPEYLVGVYDIVNIRNFAFITQGAELEAVAHRLLRLLKPGGYIQWTDIDVNSVRVGKIQPEGQTYLQTTLMEIFKGSDVRLRPAWVPTLLAAFTEAGFIEVTADIKLDVDVTVDIKVAPTYLAQALHECEMPAIEAVPRNISSIKGTRTTLKQTAGKAANETRDDLYLAFASTYMRN